MPEREVFTVKGKAVVHGVFDLTGRNAARVAGLRVEDGLLKKNALFRVIRGGETVCGSKRRAGGGGLPW